MSQKTLSRRRFLASAAASAIAAPFVNLGRYPVCAASNVRYGERAIALVNDSIVMDMLSLLDMARVPGGNFRRSLGRIRTA